MEEEIVIIEPITETEIVTLEENIEYVEPVTQEKTVTPTTSSQEVTPDTGYTGLSKVNVEAVTNEIDSNITPDNIVKDVEILGVTGTAVAGGVDLNDYFDMEPSSITSSNIWAAQYFCKKAIPLTLPTNISSASGLLNYNSIPLKIKFENNITDMFRIFYNNNAVSIDVSEIDTSNVINMNSAFRDNTNLATVDISNFNTDKVTDYSYFFDNCNNLENIIGIENLNVSKSKELGYFFTYCYKLKSLDLSKWQFANSVNLYQMFDGCSKLKNLILNKEQTIKPSNISYLFEECKELEGEMDLSNFDLSNVEKNCVGLFRYCYKLKSIILPDNYTFAEIGSSLAYACYSLTKLVIPGSVVATYNNSLYACYHFTGTRQTAYNPEGLQDGYLYVPDDLVDTYKTATGWVTFASQIKGLSELEA